MNDLISRLEAATGPNRILDRYICDLVCGKQSWHSPTVEWCRLYHARPTASIDAALTLVPEGWWVVLRLMKNAGAERGHYHCDLERDPDIAGRDLEDDEAEVVGSRNRPSAALAICIAALKALAEQQDAPIAGHRGDET